MTATSEHRFLANALEHAALDGPAETEMHLRRVVAARAAGGPPITNPYDTLARQIGEAAQRVTDAQVHGVLQAAGSQKATFEIIAAAAVGAGLLRWSLGMKVLGEALNEAK